MKSILRNTLLYSFGLYFLSMWVTGFVVSGGIATYLLGGFVLTLLTFIIKPVLNILSLPLNLLTLGMFSIVTNVVILYLLTIFVTKITIHAFVFHKTSFLGIIIPTVSLNHFMAFVVSAIFLSVIVSTIDWLFMKK